METSTSQIRGGGTWFTLMPRAAALALQAELHEQLGATLNWHPQGTRPYVLTRAKYVTRAYVDVCTHANSLLT